jgi:hypothetical protein
MSKFNVGDRVRIIIKDDDAYNKVGTVILDDGRDHLRYHVAFPDGIRSYYDAEELDFPDGNGSYYDAEELELVVEEEETVEDLLDHAKQGEPPVQKVMVQEFVSFTYTYEDDEGFTKRVSINASINNLYDMMEAYKNLLMSAGYTYVDEVYVDDIDGTVLASA